VTPQLNGVSYTVTVKIELHCSRTIRHEGNSFRNMDVVEAFKLLLPELLTKRVACLLPNLQSLVKGIAANLLAATTFS
jgi:hypothetical protein